MNVYGNLVNVAWSNATLFFYFTVIFSTWFCATYLKDVTFKMGEKSLVFPLGIVVSSSILILVKGFSACGRDVVTGYYWNFKTAETFESLGDQTLEIGYKILNVIIKNLKCEYPVFIFIIAVLTIVPIAYIANRYKDNIDIGILFFIYATFFFFPGLSAMRSCLAASYNMLAVVNVYENKTVKSVFWMIIAISLHTGSWAIVVPIVLYMFFKRFDRKILFIGLSVLFLGLFLTRNVWATVLAGRYQHYSVFDSISFGFEEIIYYLPFFVFVYYNSKKCNNSDLKRYTLLYLASGLFFGMLGYIVLIFGRIQEAFVAITLICAYYSKKGAISMLPFAKISKISLLIYGYARFYYFIIGNYDQIDIMPYVNVFGWVCD